MSLDQRLANAEYEIINNRGKNSQLIDEIVSYDKPDIILLHKGKPVLVIEKTQEVPTGHNVGQRFARLVKAIELGITVFAFFPFRARKHGAYSSICNLNIRFLKASFNMFEIHKTYLLAVNWPSDESGELINDGNENNEIQSLLRNFLDSDFDKHNNAFQSHYTILEEEYRQRLFDFQAYGSLPNSVDLVSTESIVSRYPNIKASQSFISNQNSYIYKIGMTPDKARRQDPYTGTQFIYDYLVCRNGENVKDKYSNLVLFFPNIDQKVWFEKNPNNPLSKSSNWYLTASALMFRDGIFYNL